MYTHADVQASLNTNEAGNPGLYPSVRDVTYGGRDSRHKTLEHALGVFLDTVDVDGSVTNEYARAATCGHSGISVPIIESLLIPGEQFAPPEPPR